MENEEEKVTPPAKKAGLSTYVIAAIIGVVVLSFLVEAYGAFTEGRPLNLELINKLLDTLTSLMGPPPVPTE
ncbi:hypothetical protein D9M68_17950 [compost metagenome]